MGCWVEGCSTRGSNNLCSTTHRVSNRINRIGNEGLRTNFRFAVLHQFPVMHDTKLYDDAANLPLKVQIPSNHFERPWLLKRRTRGDLPHVQE